MESLERYTAVKTLYLGDLLRGLSLGLTRYVEWILDLLLEVGLDVVGREPLEWTLLRQRGRYPNGKKNSSELLLEFGQRF